MICKIIHKIRKEGFMKENILIALAILILATMWVQISNTNTKSRYDVVTGSNMITILVDKKTGETWRNCICGEKSNVPGCWEKMVTLNPEPFNKPQGEVKALKKMSALIKKQEKLQKELEKTKQNQPTEQGQNQPLKIGG